MSSVRKHLVLCFAVIQITFGCIHNTEQDRTHCASFEALQQAGEHADWNKLNLINDGKASFSTIKSGTFKSYPNVNDLQVKGLANGIEKGAFDGLNKLHELHLDDNKFHVIQRGVFSNLPVEVVYIFFCDVHVIEPNAFENMPKINYLFLYGNSIATIQNGVFTNTKISHLIMRKNGIKTVEANAFGDMDNLVHLSLEENELTSFEPQNAIGFAPKITHLYINRNKLTQLTRGMMSVLPNLQVLLVNINSIVRFGDYAFKDLKELRLLDASNNRLEEFQLNLFSPKGLKNLQLLFLHDNQLSFLSSGVLIRLPNLKKMSVGGNPWQCPCWDILDNFMFRNNITRLCYDEYTQGSRPFCVFSETHPKDCIYDVENVRDIPKLYAEVSAEYTKLPPVCNVDGVDKPVLAS